MANKSSLHTYARGWVFRDAKNKHPQLFSSKCSLSAGVNAVQGWTPLRVSFAENNGFSSLWFMESLFTFIWACSPWISESEGTLVHKPAIKSCRAHAQAVGCNIGWDKFLVQVLHQNLEQRLTSCTQKEPKDYPSFGFSEQKCLCLLAHTHTLSQQRSGIKTVIPSSISGMMRDLGMHGNVNYNIRNRLAEGLSSNEHKPLQPPTKNKK